MNAIELLVRNQNMALEMFKMTVADLTDQDMLTRPCPAANHSLWQIGHLCVAETNLLNGVKPGAMPALPAGFAEKFANDKKTNLVDDPKVLGTKQQIVDQFIKTHQAAMAFTKTLTEADLDKPAAEKVRNRMPTVADVVGLQAIHLTMHVGQIQAIRRKLGKPIVM